MIFELLRSHVPRSWQAVAALLVMILAAGIAFNALTLVLVQPSAGTWLKFTLGLVIALPASIYFYRRQIADSHPKTAEQLEVERLAEMGQALREQQQAPTITAYHLNDTPEDAAKKIN